MEEIVSLLKVHRLLIGSGIAMCVIYSVVHALKYLKLNVMADLISALVAVLVAIALGVYFRTIRTS